MRRLLISTLLAVAAPAAATPDPVFPKRQLAGPFKSGHVQGIAVDRKSGYIYYSFTNMLAKYDFRGRLVGTLVGWTGHLGDLDFNEADGKVYGSLEYGKQDAFYIAVIDGGRIDRIGIPAQGSDILRTVYLPEVTRDYAAPGHRYGCSGIDGVAFGPAFGRADGRHYLTVAYGIYGDNARSDNDHQVLLQYDAGDWARHARPLEEGPPHRQGPLRPRTKVFVRTGNTRYGVQNLAYDETLKRWFMGVYTGSKPSFPNYSLFAIDALAQPARRALSGVPGKNGDKEEQGLVLPLSRDGLEHPASGIRGWNSKADVGLQPLGQGLYYLAVNSRSPEGQAAEVKLMRWAKASATGFTPVP
ncbi:hypothetical protein [Novosphingobium kaempferiae]|uniref:hypothetical protein n=1 Tax=Novosphingobium kaempferiae TaxID=2896849 RepID=UPI001E632C35|nr:hypothetical protein [Novosphingobium kaempferiae]